MNTGGSPVKAVPEAVTGPRRNVRHSKPWVRSRAPFPPEGPPLQQTAARLGPSTDPPGEVEEMEVEDATPWTAQ